MRWLIEMAKPQFVGSGSRALILSKITMSSTSQKHRNFVSEPMGDKNVDQLAGIGPVLSERLSEKGYDKVSLLIKFYLLFYYISYEN